MYDNIGGKIKGLARAIFIVLAVAAIITGIVFCAMDDDLIIIGLIIMVAGTLVSWISSWLLYGYGELIESACEIASNTRGGARKSNAQIKVDSKRISELEKLRSQGLITEEEYQQAMVKEK